MGAFTAGFVQPVSAHWDRLCQQNGGAINPLSVSRRRSVINILLAHQQSMNIAKPIRVLIVDDSALVRKMLKAALAGDKQIEVVGTAPDAYIARDKILTLKPDVITLDIEMPRMDGITFLKKLMQFKPIPVIVISSLGHAACQASVDALRAGAVEILCKPNGPYSIGELGVILAEKIRTAASTRLPVRGLDRDCGGTSSSPSSLKRRPRVNRTQYDKDKIIVIGASTGGPGAIAEVLGELPSNTPPILIVQHMPPIFTAHFASRLNQDCQIEVKEAVDGDELLPGRALIAPGNFHMTLRKSDTGLRVQISDGPQVCFSRPSVDVLFYSVASVAKNNAIGVLLTGMGADGARGLAEMRNCGASTIAQDEGTCVVFGMPKEAIRMGAVEKVLPLNQIASSILSQLTLNPV
jgi:two-component system, chemotaxis family, protein-glutamate methylesterase/glutaminase